MHSIYRLIDAVCNRVSEGLRVLEDVARFVLDNDEIGGTLKFLRHEVRNNAAKIMQSTEILAIERDTENDIGTGWKSKDEYSRRNLTHIISANSKRVAEGLRTLEETSKYLSTDAETAQFFEKARYNVYTIEKSILSLFSIQKLSKCKLMLIFDPYNCDTEPYKALEEALTEGFDSVQFRVKDYVEKEKEILKDARKAHEICERHESLFLVNDRADWALILNADGLHVGQNDISPADARMILRTNQLLGFSTSNEDELKIAQECSIDYVGVGAVFQTQTKAAAIQSGLKMYEKALQMIELPVFALGGITEENVIQVKEAAQRNNKTLRICVSAAIMKSNEPGKIAKNIADIVID